MILDHGQNVAYRYRVITASWANVKNTLVSEVEQWAKESNIDCVIIPGSAYFRNEADAAFFMLRWG